MIALKGAVLYQRQALTLADGFRFREHCRPTHRNPPESCISRCPAARRFFTAASSGISMPYEFFLDYHSRP